MSAQLLEPEPYFSSRERIAMLLEAGEHWFGTPFRAHGRIPGPRGGCSCETLPLMLYYEAGFLPNTFRIPSGRVDWHRAAQTSIMVPFLDAAPQFLRTDPTRPEVGDLLGFFVGRVVHHLAVLFYAGRFLHCLEPFGVHWSCLADATWRKRLGAVWRPVIPPV